MFFKHLRGQHDQRDHGRRQSVFRSNIGGGGGGSGGPLFSTSTSSRAKISSVSQDEGYLLRPYQALTNTIRQLVDPNNTLSSQLISVQKKTPQGVVIEQKTIADHINDIKKQTERRISKSSSVSDRDLLNSEYMLNKARSNAQNHAKVIQSIQEGKISGTPDQVSISRGLLIEAYVQSEIYRDIYNRGLLERKQSIPHPTIPIFSISKGNYVPSQRAINISASMNNPNHSFSTQLIQTLSNMKTISAERKKIFDSQNALVTEAKTSTDPVRKKRIREELKELNERLLTFRQDESQIHKNIVSAVQSLGFDGQFTGKVNAKIKVSGSPSTSSVSLQSFIHNTERTTKERLEIATIILQQIIPHSTLGIKKPLRIIVDENITRASVEPQKHVIKLNPKDGVRTLVHEMLHIIEEDNPVLKDRVAMFFSKRTRNSSKEPLSNYGNYRNNEFTKVDNFGHPYMGKVYSQGSEILSMFSDYLLLPPNTRKTEEYNDDPEYIQFVADVLMDPTSYQ